MTVKEGSLEPPRRLPIDGKSATYFDEAALADELERVFDICHGCRRCVSLCAAFPALFDLIDEGGSGEVDAIPKHRYREVVDLCYLCDMCFMTKCPYVPPHRWNVDFPHLMLRAKAVGFRKNGAAIRDRVLTSTDAIGKLAAIPVVAQAVNAVNRNPVARVVLQSMFGVHKDRRLPPYAAHKFRTVARPVAGFPVRDGERTPGKVAVFSTCYVSYNEPGIGEDLLRVLAHNEVPAVLVDKVACCGMPKLELGDLARVEELAAANIPRLLSLARDGFAILSPVPSCTLMFKQELPLLLPDDESVRAVANAVFDPFEYFMLRHRDGLLKTDFRQELGRVAYHVPCHTRVQNMGLKTRDVLQLVPGTQITTVERCAGHDGTWGVKREYFALSMKIGKPVFRQLQAADPDFVSSDCPIAARHVMQGIGDAPGSTRARKAHPLTLLRMAYGLD
jgi:glycerol-3-phosphate dehydrogenase subunit C